MIELMRKLQWGAGVAAVALAGWVYAADDEKSEGGKKHGTDVSVQIGGGRGINVEVRHGSREQDLAQKDLQTGKFSVRRLSKLYSKNLYNDRGEDVGDIESVVIDPHAGQIAFAIVEFDSAMGVGDKNFAIPWTAIHKEVDQKDFDKISFSMNVDSNKLQQAKGFDEDNWPNLADRTLARDLHTLWGQQPYWEGAVAQARMRAQPTITGTPISPEHERGQREPGRGALLLRGNDLVGHKLLDQKGQEFAELEEIMVDPKSGALLYGIVQIDQAPDFSKDYMHPVPWQVISVRYTGHDRPGAGRDVGDRADEGRSEPMPGRETADEERGLKTADLGRGKVLTDSDQFQLVLNVSRDKLQNGPKFGEREWPNMTSQWGEQVYNHYGVQPFWKEGMKGDQETPGESR